MAAGGSINHPKSVYVSHSKGFYLSLHVLLCTLVGNNKNVFVGSLCVCMVIFKLKYNHVVENTWYFHKISYVVFPQNSILMFYMFHCQCGFTHITARLLFNRLALELLLCKLFSIMP